jgi:hypothetical protein
MVGVSDSIDRSSRRTGWKGRGRAGNSGIWFLLVASARLAVYKKEKPALRKNENNHSTKVPTAKST